MPGLARLGRIDMAMYKGRYKEADRLVADALAADEKTANVAAQAQHNIDAAQIAVALNQPARAAAAARKASDACHARKRALSGRAHTCRDRPSR